MAVPEPFDIPVVVPPLEAAVQVKLVLMMLDIRVMDVFDLLQIVFFKGLFIRVGRESTFTCLVMESLHPSVE